MPEFFGHKSLVNGRVKSPYRKRPKLVKARRRIKIVKRKPRGLLGWLNS